jgi:hypothetical protein
MTATEMATELGDRIKHEGEKLKALELVTLPVRKKKQPKRSKLGTLTLVAAFVAVGYAIFKSLRARTTEQPTVSAGVTDLTKPAAPDRAQDQRLATAGL